MEKKNIKCKEITLKKLVILLLQDCCCRQLCEKIVPLFTWLSSDLKHPPLTLYWCCVLILASELLTDDYGKVLWVIQRVEPQKHALNNSCIVLKFDKAGFYFFNVLPKCQYVISLFFTSLLFQLNSIDQLLPTKLSGAHFTSGV